MTWLPRFLDQIRFFLVSEAELEDARDAFPFGRYPLRIENTVFRAREYAAFLETQAGGIREFETRQQSAFEAERRHWQQSGLDRTQDPVADTEPEPEVPLPPGAVAVEAQVPGTVWKIEVIEGGSVETGQTLPVLESMKMEMRIAAPVAGRLASLLCHQGSAVAQGQRVAIITRNQADAPTEIKSQ